MTATARARPPAYPSRAQLAYELDMAESTVDEMVKRGVLPGPIKLSTGCVRWVWADVVTALASLKASPGGTPAQDAYTRGAQNVHKIEGRRDAS